MDFSELPQTANTPKQPSHFVNKKFLITIAALLLVAGGAYAGMFYWQSNVNTPVVTFTPRPNDMANWKTYTNTQYGFEFKYPEDWVDKSTDKNIEVDSPSAGLEKDILAFRTIVVVLDVSNNENYKKDILDNSNYKISNLPALSSLPLNNPKNFVRNTAVVKGDNAFVIGQTYYGDEKYIVQSKLIFDQILSSFKFSSSINVDTSSWNTYTNNKYGYSLKYPPGWTYDSSVSTIISFYPPGKHKDTSQGYSGDVIINNVANPNKLDLKTFYQTVKSPDFNMFEESVSQSSFPANYESEKFVGVYGEQSTDVISIDKGNLVIEISDVNAPEEILDAMASSLK